MQQAIQRIIEDIDEDCVFDSHFVIAQLIKREYDTYLRFVVTRFQADTLTTAIVHGQLAEQITVFIESDIGHNIAERLDDLESFSENVQGNACKCACWRKIRTGR